MRTDGPGLPFKQAVGVAHRAVVDIKVHLKRLHAARNWIECWGLPRPRPSYAQAQTETAARDEKALAIAREKPQRSAPSL